MVEPYLSVHPADPDHLLVGVIVISADMADSDCATLHSLDGGETWIPEVTVSGESSCPISPRNGTAGMRFPAGGDYHGLAALPDGTFRVVWSDARSGIFDL